MRLHKSKKGSKETVVLVMSLVVILALGFVLLVGGVGKISETFKNLFKKNPAECSQLGIQGKCACTFDSRTCPTDGAVTSTDCPQDGYGPIVCRNPSKTKNALSKAAKDNGPYGHCCYEKPRQSIFA